MSEQQEKDPYMELKAIFETASDKAREAWTLARQRSESMKQENEIYRELVSLGSAAVDALERAVKKAWEGSSPK